MTIDTGPEEAGMGERRADDVRGEDVLAERRWRTADAKLIEAEGVDKVRAACLSLAAADVAALHAAVGGGPVVVRYLDDAPLDAVDDDRWADPAYRLTVPGDPQESEQ